MLARQMDANHPFHDQDTPSRQANAMRTIYREVDEMVGWAMEVLGTARATLTRDVGSRFRAVSAAGEPEQLARAKRLPGADESRATR